MFFKPFRRFRAKFSGEFPVKPMLYSDKTYAFVTNSLENFPKSRRF